jgi:Cu+-exporting ATPase
MSQESCYHCGDPVIGKPILYDDKPFCCNGCSTVYQLLSQNDLGDFYSMEKGAGIRPEGTNAHKYAFLDVPDIRNKYITFEDDKAIHLNLFLPTIHCSSCIYLLENIEKIEPNVLSCNVNFVQKTAAIVLKKETALGDFALLLDKIGYAPNFGDKKALEKKRNYQYLYKLGIAGFAFGSIMLWTFPEYLGIGRDNPEIRTFTAYLSLAVSIPVLLYSASDYLKSAWKALRYKSLNLDVPISIGIVALYAQSVYSILSEEGTGYMDSFAGFIFFLLIGKWFQSKTYESLSFERDYTAYFPVAVTRVNDDTEEIVEIDTLEKGDTMRLRNEEIIPCDATLISETATIDYSFVTGESDPIRMTKGNFIYAGGKIIGTPALLRAESESNRSELTRMWKDAQTTSKGKEASDKLSIYFLSGVLVLAIAAAISWWFIDSSRTVEIVVAVLIVACPCALALSKPFTYGNITRVLGRKGLYLKEVEVIEKLNEVTDIVFDKTGTLTSNRDRKVSYTGKELSVELKNAIATMTAASSHPLSEAITRYLSLKGATISTPETFEEISGKGIQGSIHNHSIRIGSAEFIGQKKHTNETEVYVAINNEFIGRFTVVSAFRKGIFDVLKTLQEQYDLHILSGDSAKDHKYISSAVPGISEIHFKQSPQDKRAYITELQNRDKKVLMIGDGLNDTGALKDAYASIAISEDIFRFTPGSDAIIDASSLHKLIAFLHISRYSRTILRLCYAFSIIYNVVGLGFALSGELTPLIAAILMPLSSISIVLISTVSALLKAGK